LHFAAQNKYCINAKLNITFRFSKVSYVLEDCWPLGATL